MMKLIIGVKGTGKTKQLVDMVNHAASTSNGSVICIEYGNNLNFDVSYKARLIDATKFGLDDANKLYGFVAGISASNHDITDLFIDGTLKICKKDVAAFAEIVPLLNTLAEGAQMNLVITVSADINECPDIIRQFA